MKIGNYEIGTPIEYGTTGDKQFVYSGNGVPGTDQPYGSNLASFYEDYNIPTPSFLSDMATFTSRRLLTQLFDTNQQFVSPGTAYGQGTEADTKNNPA